MKCTKEEKIKLIQDNNVNIIWLDNPFVDISAITTLFSSINDKDYTIITIAPKSETHFLVKKSSSIYEKDNTMIESFFVNNYFIE